jgi:uridine kinase
MQSERRRKLLLKLANHIMRLPSAGIRLIAIDGVDGAGKTIFADELEQILSSLGTRTIRASVDGFHNPRAVRYRLGKSSPDGFYLDSYDYVSLRKELLDPLGTSGSRLYRKAVFNHVTDERLATPIEAAATGTVLVMDGIFLHRPELRDYWNLSVFLQVPFEISIPRGAGRGEGFGSPDPEAESNLRYIEGQKRYLRECNPQEQATYVIDNSDLNSPYIFVSGR